MYNSFSERTNYDQTLNLKYNYYKKQEQSEQILNSKKVRFPMLTSYLNQEIMITDIPRKVETIINTDECHSYVRPSMTGYPSSGRPSMTGRPRMKRKTFIIQNSF